MNPGTGLTPIEARVLGCLIEKQAATPDAYPLTLNALVVACNQKTSRDPVMKLDPGVVGHTLREMEGRDLVRMAYGSRAERWEHRADAVYSLDKPRRVLLGLLLLRGAQTVAELHTRSERMHPFADNGAVHAALEQLAGAGLVKCLARDPGQRGARWAHLLSGEPTEPAAGAVRAAAPVEVRVHDAELAARVEELEARVAALEEKLGSPPVQESFSDD